MTFNQLAWELEGVPQRRALSDQERQAIRAGTLRAVALLFPGPSKCDPDGAPFGAKPIPFPVTPSDPEALGSLLMRLEECVLPSDRRATPLLADSDGEPFLGASMDRALQDALLAYNPAVAATRSWHSYRIRLASKLRAASLLAGALLYDDAVIQAMLRWKSTASIKTYARFDSATYAKILATTDNVDISTVQYTSLPERTEYDRLDALAAAADTELPALDAPQPVPSHPRRALPLQRGAMARPRPIANTAPL